MVLILIFSLYCHYLKILSTCEIHRKLCKKLHDCDLKKKKGKQQSLAVQIYTVLKTVWQLKKQPTR